MLGDRNQEPQRRIRIGLTGLAFVFLLVLLGTAISRSGNDGEGAAANVALPNESAGPNEPLAEIGAAPGQTPGDDIAGRAAKSAAAKTAAAKAAKPAK
ncbi:MAG: hypothetical protein ABIT69_05235 [Sphingomicrobium sp.]